MSDLAIRVEDLRKNYGSVEALKGIDFEVPAESIFGLLGPNGAGKTTAIRILSTILRPDSGRAEVMGRDVLRFPADVRKTIGLAGQSTAVDEHLTGRENLMLAGRLAHVARRELPGRVEKLLERFDLTQAAGRTLKTYSGGMRRRLDVAAALVGRAPVLFLDEPTTGLDIHSRSELWEVIRELVREGSTVLLTTQYLEEADQLADRIAVIDEGVVVANDTAAALKSRLGTTSIEIEMADKESAERAKRVLSDLFSDHAARDGNLVRFMTNRGPGALIKALGTLQSEDLEPENLSIRQPMLDEVFLALTSKRAKNVESEEVE
jgi:daunorubicin resistance ABC transporter ATP-binding subunit